MEAIAPKRRGRPRKTAPDAGMANEVSRDAGNAPDDGADGQDVGAGAGVSNAADAGGSNAAVVDGRGRVTYADVRDAALAAESMKPQRLITALWCVDESAPQMFNGKHSDAPVFAGEPAYRLHTGEIVPV